MKIRIDQNLCKACGVCVDVCPLSVIQIQDGSISIDQGRCTLCQACIEGCPTGALAIAYDVERIERISPVPLAQNAPANKSAQVTGARPQTRLGESVLALVGETLLPLVIGSLVSYLDRRLAAQAGPQRAPIVRTSSVRTSSVRTDDVQQVGQDAPRCRRQRRRRARLQDTPGRKW